MPRPERHAAPPTGRVLPDWYLRSRLKMRQVLLLVALEEQRNMHRAAASLRMTQPAATRLLGRAEVQRIRGAGLACYAWTVNEPAQADRLIAWRVDGIVTDRPGLMRARVDRS